MTNDDFTQLVHTYSKLIFTVCYRFTTDYQEAENLSQDTFLTAFKVIDNFVGENYKAWLVKIATNKCKDFLKSANVRRTSVIEDEQLYLIKDTNNLNEQVEQNDTIAHVKQVCEDLGEPYSKVAILYFIEDKTFKEISDVLDVPIKTVQTRAYRARDKLKNILKEVPLYGTQ